MGAPEKAGAGKKKQRAGMPTLKKNHSAGARPGAAGARSESPDPPGPRPQAPHASRRQGSMPEAARSSSVEAPQTPSGVRRQGSMPAAPRAINADGAQPPSAGRRQSPVVAAVSSMRPEAAQIPSAVRRQASMPAAPRPTSAEASQTPAAGRRQSRAMAGDGPSNAEASAPRRKGAGAGEDRLMSAEAAQGASASRRKGPGAGEDRPVSAEAAQGTSTSRRQSRFPAPAQQSAGADLLDSEALLRILARLEKVPLAPKSLADATSADTSAEAAGEAPRGKPGSSILRWALGARGAPAKEKGVAQKKPGAKSKGADFSVVNCITAGPARQSTLNGFSSQDYEASISWAMGFLPKTWVPQSGWGDAPGSTGASASNENFLQVLHVTGDHISPTKVHAVKVLGGFLASSCPEEPMEPSQDDSAAFRKYTIVAAHLGDGVCDGLKGLADLGDLAPGVLEEMEAWLKRMVELDAHYSESKPVVVSRLTRTRAVGIIKAAHLCWKEERAKRRQLEGEADADSVVVADALGRLGLVESTVELESSMERARGKARIRKCQTLDERARAPREGFGDSGLVENEPARRLNGSPSNKSSSLPRTTSKDLDRESTKYLARRAKAMRAWNFEEKSDSRGRWSSKRMAAQEQESEDVPPLAAGLLAPPKALVRGPEQENERDAPAETESLSESASESSDSGSSSGDDDRAIQHWDKATNSGESSSTSAETLEDSKGWSTQVSAEPGDSPADSQLGTMSSRAEGKGAGLKDGLDSPPFKSKSMRLQTVLEEHGDHVSGPHAKADPNKKGAQRLRPAGGPSVGGLSEGTEPSVGSGGVQAGRLKSSSATRALMAHRLDSFSAAGRHVTGAPAAHPSHQDEDEALARSPRESYFSGEIRGFARSASLDPRGWQSGPLDWAGPAQDRSGPLPAAHLSSAYDTGNRSFARAPGVGSLLSTGPVHSDQSAHGHEGSVMSRGGGSDSGSAACAVDGPSTPPQSEASSFKPYGDHRITKQGEHTTSKDFSRSQSLLSRRAAAMGPGSGAPQERKELGHLRLDRPGSTQRSQVAFMHSKSMPPPLGSTEGSLNSPRLESLSLKTPKLDVTSSRVLSQFAPST